MRRTARRSYHVNARRRPDDYKHRSVRRSGRAVLALVFMECTPRPPADCTATTHAAVSGTCLPRLHIPNDKCRLVAPVLEASAKLRTSADVLVYRPLDVLRSHPKRDVRTGLVRVGLRDAWPTARDVVTLRTNCDDILMHMDKKSPGLITKKCEGWRPSQKSHNERVFHYNLPTNHTRFAQLSRGFSRRGGRALLGLFLGLVDAWLLGPRVTQAGACATSCFWEPRGRGRARPSSRLEALDERQRWRRVC